MKGFSAITIAYYLISFQHLVNGQNLLKSTGDPKTINKKRQTPNDNIISLRGAASIIYELLGNKVDETYRRLTQNATNSTDNIFKDDEEEKKDSDDIITYMGPTCPNGNKPILDIFCGRGPTREDCPTGSKCFIHPTDYFAICCYLSDMDNDVTEASDTTTSAAADTTAAASSGELQIMECPKEKPHSFDTCYGDALFECGNECCCGTCNASYRCRCTEEGYFMCQHTDSCFKLSCKVDDDCYDGATCDTANGVCC